MFLALMELLMGLLLVVFFVTQILYPLLDGRPVFPFLQRENKLREELADERQKTIENKIQNNIKKEKGRRVRLLSFSSSP